MCNRPARFRININNYPNVPSHKDVCAIHLPGAIADIGKPVEVHTIPISHYREDECNA